MMHKDYAVRHARSDHANYVIQVISERGRRFFYSHIYGRAARFFVDDVGQVWYVDDHTGMQLYPLEKKAWHGFSHGSTLKALVHELAQYIQTGEPLHIDWFPVERDAELWAYTEKTMLEVRKLVLLCPAVTKELAQ